MYSPSRKREREGCTTFTSEGGNNYTTITYSTAVRVGIN
jgi:hypothetical protein